MQAIPFVSVHRYKLKRNIKINISSQIRLCHHFSRFHLKSLPIIAPNLQQHHSINDSIYYTQSNVDKQKYTLIYVIII